MVTFAVMCRNEERLVANALRQALDAAGPDDRVILADGGSSDGSARVARSLGVEVLAVPAGKGSAMAAVRERFDQGRLCFLDADIERSSGNIAATLAASIAASGTDMVVGDFDWPQKRFTGALDAVYRPLVGALFPEAVAIAPRMPFSGFRVLDASADTGPLPPRWGAETHLNVQLALSGRVGTADLGVYEGPNRPKTPALAHDASAAILGAAQQHARLDSSRRPAWEDWVAGALPVLVTQPGSGEAAGDYAERLAHVAARPLPAARVALSA